MIANPVPYMAEQTLLAKVAEKYRRDGYDVIVEPKESDLPFDLGAYQPDLLVKKPGGEGFIIEIKESAARTAVGRYRELAEIVAGNTGWRFLLITGEDTALEEKKQLLSWPEIWRRRESSEHLLALGELEAAFLSLWSITEATLRKRAEEKLIPIEHFPPLSLIRQLYSQGELSMEQFDKLTPLYQLRNRVVHGFQTPDLKKSAAELQALVDELLHSWSPTERNDLTKSS